MRRRRALALAGALAVAILAGAPAAFAHALLESSVPADGAQLSSAPSEVVLTFTERPDPKLSTIHVLDTSGASLEKGSLSGVRGHPDELRIGLKPLSKGVYTVSWRTVSRVDGHVTGGAFAFGVGQPVGNVTLPSVATPRPSVLSVISRALYYFGLILLIGAAFAIVFVFGGALRAGRQLDRSGLAFAVTGLIGFAESQRRAAGVTLGAFARTSLGQAMAWRAAPLLLAIVVLVFTRTRARFAVVFAGAAGALSFLAHVSAGHAGAGRLWWVSIGVQWVHVLAAGIWIGGLVALLVGIKGTDTESRPRAVRRFSAAALFALLFVAGTGLARAASEVGSWHELFASSFGRLVIAKSVLLLALLGLGALNRYRSVPRSVESTSLLERVSRAEIAIALVVFVLTGILSGVTPGRSVLAAEQAVPRPIVVEGADFGTTVNVRLAVSPGFAGRNTYDVRIRDYDSGAPVQSQRVSLRFTFLDSPLAGSSTAVLVKRAPGQYAAAGTDLSLEGRWRVTVVIERGVNSVEVPLELQTKTQPEKIQVIPGSPTLYNITLTGTRSVQMYVDPGKPGHDEVHATFFENGGEFPNLTNVVITAAQSARAPQPLTYRALSPGHFVGEAQLTAGDWKFTVRAVAPDGAMLVAYFEQEIA